MPPISPLGWFHTAMGIIALVSAVYALSKYKEITFGTRSGQIYLVATLITAATALAIFQHGFFGPAHVLAVLTLGALLVGTTAATTRLFGKLSRYVMALSFTATLLFHSIPAAAERSDAGFDRGSGPEGVLPRLAGRVPYRRWLPASMDSSATSISQYLGITACP